MLTARGWTAGLSWNWCWHWHGRKSSDCALLVSRVGNAVDIGVLLLSHDCTKSASLFQSSDDPHLSMGMTNGLKMKIGPWSKAFKHLFAGKKPLNTKAKSISHAEISRKAKEIQRKCVEASKLARKASTEA
jgi:hypothetical protein